MSEVAQTEGFNPRSPCGERRLYTDRYPDAEAVSTHAPLAGSDKLVFVKDDREMSFNPRSPCGERPMLAVACMAACSFQPTLPLRGATTVLVQPFAYLPFQPTLPLRGATTSG